MRIYKDLSIEINGTNTHYFDLADFQSDDHSSALYYGYTFICNQAHADLLRAHEKNIYLNVVPPTEFCGPYDVNVEDRFDEIYSICPFTVDWLNKIKATSKYKKIWYPFHSKYIPENCEKKYDVCYHGGIHSDKYSHMLEVLRGFNYRYMSMSHDINPMTQAHLPLATDLDLSHEEKITRISQCKISVCYNNFPIRNSVDLHYIKSQPKWQDNNAFSHVDSLGILPQLKSRFIEASVSKTINLVERDPWNVIEDWYEPDKHFVYFDNNNDLSNKIKNILGDWPSYQQMLEDSYNHSIENYTCDHLIKEIENNEL
jgi:hypothetical protein